MKKTFYVICVLLLLFPSLSVSAPVSQSLAQQAAISWINRVTEQPLDIISVTETFTDDYDEYPSYYIFNFSPDGWVIISAEDAAYPVIGYSNTGGYSPQNRPPAFTGWMNVAREQIKDAQRRRLKSTQETIDAWNILLNESHPGSRKSQRSGSVGPLLTTTWNQGKYYNKQCPGDANAREDYDNRVPVGCVAVAIAQIMKYHNYPTWGVGSYGYSSNYGYLTANFGTTRYNWSVMPDALYSYNDEVARLLYHCGVSVEMNYGPYSSSASIYNAAKALRTYFKYDQQLFHTHRDHYTEIEWKNLIIRDLDLGLPVLYAGYDEHIKNGHAFVCDGYTINDFFHFNWGWGGNSDGYFYLSNLTPSGRDYRYHTEAVFQIRPIPPILSDVIISLQVIAGINPANIRDINDINLDGAIGIQEAIYALRSLANITTVCKSSEDFEPETPYSLTWSYTYSDGKTWNISDYFPRNGVYAAQSPVLDKGGTVSMQTNVFSDGGSLSFWYAQSNVYGYTQTMKFYLNNSLKYANSYSTAYTKISYPITSGAHNLKWEYSRSNYDSYTSTGYVVIDDICVD